MTNAGEVERFKAVYAGLGDGELERMAKDPESLTDDALAALTATLRERGLGAPAPAKAPLSDGAGVLPQVHEAAAGEERSDAFGVGVPGVFPGAATAVEVALEPAGEVRDGMAQLWGTADGLDLSQACAALEAAGVEPAIEEIAGDATVGSPTRFEIWVSVADVERGKAALTGRLGEVGAEEMPLLPDNGDEEYAGESERVVGEFATRTEAEAVEKMLSQAGYSARVEDSLMNDGGFAVAVEPAEYEAALALLASRLGLQS